MAARASWRPAAKEKALPKASTEPSGRRGAESGTDGAPAPARARLNTAGQQADKDKREGDMEWPASTSWFASAAAVRAPEAAEIAAETATTSTTRAATPSRLYVGLRGSGEVAQAGPGSHLAGQTSPNGDPLVNIV